jgi:hypothetical protein
MSNRERRIRGFLLATAAALFVVGISLVMSDPIFSMWIEKFQTILAGILAIVAAWVAYNGVVSAAKIQSKAALAQARVLADAGHAQARATLEAIQKELSHQVTRDEVRYRQERIKFRNAVLASANTLRNDIRSKKAFISEMRKTQGYVSRDGLHVLRVNQYPVLKSDWKDLSLLDAPTMEQIIRLQTWLTSVNDAVTRLELQPEPFPEELIADLEEYYDIAIKYISEFVPARAAELS